MLHRGDVVFVGLVLVVLLPLRVAAGVAA
jgi:hypothetical protein